MGIVIHTPPDNVAFSIALSVLLLSVVLHPIVEACFQRIRADRAWRSIEKHEKVDVTKYNIFSEAMGDRGRWDTARVITLLLAAFHVSTWGLELSLDLALNMDGPVDLLNRPPPVLLRAEVVDPAHNLTDWIVLSHGQPLEGGVLGNFHGELDDGNATASYRIGERIISGETLFASWSMEAARIESGLFYDRDNGRAVVEGINCSGDSRKGALYVGTIFGATDKWGDVTECERGPKLDEGNATVPPSPPTILLNSTKGLVHMIVEEESSYPSFLYSVWTPGEATSGVTYLDHVFYISSTTRLAEAIVSGVANGVLTGGGCVDLLASFSVTNTTYDVGDAIRASPFGEHPGSSSVERLDQVEPIVEGVLVSNLGSVCGALLILVTSSAFIGCLYFRSSRSLDVYNRDKLIRAVSMPSGEDADGKPVALKIYVRRTENEAFSIVISDDGVYRGCIGLRKRVLMRLKDRSANVAPRSLDRTMSISGSFPAGSRELTFDGVRPTFDDDRRRSKGLYRDSLAQAAVPTPRVPNVVELIASPVPSASLTSPVLSLPRHRRGLAVVNLNESPASDLVPDLAEIEPLRHVTRQASRAPRIEKEKPLRGDVEAQAAPPAE